jgi:hypothetical protein
MQRTRPSTLHLRSAVVPDLPDCSYSQTTVLRDESWGVRTPLC